MTAGGEVAVQEAAMEANQELHKAKDTFLAIGLAVPLGGLMGRVFGHTLTPARDIGEMTSHPLSPEAPPEKIILPEGVDAYDVLERQKESLSAAAAPVDTTRPAQGANLGWLLDAGDPNGRMIRAAKEHPEMFTEFSRLAETSVYTEANLNGIKSPFSAELVSEAYKLKEIVANEEYRSIYDKMLKEVYGEGKIVNRTKNLLGMRKERITDTEFSDYVGLRMQAEERLAPEVIESIPEDIRPYVEEAVKVYQKYFKENGDELVRLGMLDADKQRQQFFPVLYNRKAILLGRDRFRNYLRKQYSAEPPPSWLEERYGVEKLADLQQSQKDEAVGEWIAEQKQSLEASANKDLKKAQKQLEDTIKSLRSARKDSTGINNKSIKDLVNEAKAETSAINKEREILVLQREQLVREKQAELAKTKNTPEQNIRAKFIDNEISKADTKLRGLEQSLEDLRYKSYWAEKQAEDSLNLKKSIKDIVKKLERQKSTQESKVAKAEKSIKRVEKFKDADQYVEETINNILNSKYSRSGQLREFVPETGRLKDRTIDWQNDIFFDKDFRGFLNTRADRVAMSYSYDMSPRMAFRKAFGTETTDGLQPQVDQIREYFAQKIEKASDIAKKQKLEAEMKQVLEDFEGVRDRILGIYGIPENPDSFGVWLGRNVKRFNTATMMDMALLPALSDAATGVFATGKWFGWMQHFHKDIGKAMEQMDQKELKALLIGAEQINRQSSRNARSLALDDPMLDYGGIGYGRKYKITAGIDRTMDFLARNTPVVSGLGGWTSKVRQVFSIPVLAKYTEELGNWKTLSAAEKSKWARLGIDEDSAARITKQMDKYPPEDVDGVTLPNVSRWDDPIAEQDFMLSFMRVMDEAVIRPGAADTPLIMSKPLGSLMLQFMSFPFASKNRYLRLMMQQKDMDALASLTMSMGLSYLGIVAREHIKGPNSKGETAQQRLDRRTMADWAYESFTRSAASGQLGIYSDIISRIGLRPVQEALGVKLFSPPSRFQERDVWTMPLGPTGGTAQNTVNLIRALLSIPTDGIDPVINKGSRLLPYNDFLPYAAAKALAEEQQ